MSYISFTHKCTTEHQALPSLQQGILPNGAAICWDYISLKVDQWNMIMKERLNDAYKEKNHYDQHKSAWNDLALNLGCFGLCIKLIKYCNTIQ